MFHSGEPDGWAGSSLAKQCRCGNDAKFALRANEGSTKGICRLRRDLCEQCLARLIAIFKKQDENA